VLNGAVIAARTAAANAHDADFGFLEFLEPGEAVKMAETLDVAVAELARLARSLRAHAGHD